jgi:hypothetical protein
MVRGRRFVFGPVVKSINNMKFKILPGCDLFDQLCEMFEHGRGYKKQAQAWAEAKGAESWAEPHNSFMGGVAGLIFDKKPVGWAHLTDKIYRPRVNSALFKEMEAVPFLSAVDINDAFGYKPRSVKVGEKFMMMHYPGVSIGDYINYYEPVEGMVEILESEYRALKNSIA